MMKMKRVVSGLCLLAGLEAFGAFVYLLLLPADPKNAILWGYSTARLTLVTGLLMAAISCALFGRFARKRSELFEMDLKWLTGKPIRLWVAGSTLFLITITAWILFWMPAYRFGGLAAKFERLLPVLIWLGLVCGQTLLLILIWQGALNAKQSWNALRSDKSIWWFVGVGMSLFVLLQVAATSLDFITSHDTQQYNPPGAPLLPLQVMAGWLVGVLALVSAGLLRRNWSHQKQNKFWEFGDWGVFLLVWVVAAVIWIGIPVQPTYFAPLKRPPDWVLFPYSDAALYDRTAQFALMGLGLRNGAYVDKPLYSSFLTVLHLIGGQDYDLVTAMQVVVLALLPALSYVLGKRVHSRPAGIAAATLIIFRGMNAIAGGHLIQTAHARLLVSELPTALMLALLAYFITRWFENPGELLFPVLAGGALGLSTLIRHNPWFLVPIIVLAAFILHWRKWKRWFVQISLFGLAMLLVIAPWMYYSQKTVGTPWYFLIPFRGVVLKNRLQPAIEENGLIPANVDKVGLSSTGMSAVGTLLLPQTGSALPVTENSATGISRVVQILSAHLYNNLRGSLLILPETMVANDLEFTLTNPNSVWRTTWTEGVSVLMVVNVIVILIGIGVSWKKLRIAGVVPFIIYAGYLVAVAVARTSGGRYLVPVDWVVLLYYAIGIVQVAAWVIEKTPICNWIDTKAVDYRVPRWQWTTGILGLILVTGMIPFVQEAIPRSDESGSEELMPSAEWMTDAGIDPSAVEDFLEGDAATISYGKALYPRFYNWKEGENLGCYGARPYPRLVFELIGEGGEQCVILPYENLSYDLQLQGSTAVVLGCEGGGAWVVMFPDEDLALMRFNQTDPPVCPLKYPICADNRSCK
jgi:hypothetical protein